MPSFSRAFSNEGSYFLINKLKIYYNYITAPNYITVPTYNMNVANIQKYT